VSQGADVGPLATASIRTWGLLTTAWLDALAGLSRSLVELAYEESAVHAPNEVVVHVVLPKGGDLAPTDFQPLHAGCAPLPASAIELIPAVLPAATTAVPVIVRVVATGGIVPGGYVGAITSGGTVVEPDIYLDVVAP
jgi:hypothetical protein